MSEWISVEDRLPDVKEWYLVVMKYQENSPTHNGVMSYEPFYKQFIPLHEVDEHRVVDYHQWIVTHWMPLPEPPKDRE